MSLTKQDLKAIGAVVEEVVEPKFESLAISTARGFAEVHGKIDSLEKKVDKIGKKQDRMLNAVLPYDIQYKRLRDVIKP
ncbi:hypothetical protein HY380_02295 [Candidatus Saccharibacteria bacterium]|nr:hypothetical protein [Candidatus Saccharibacteria bacterium]